MNTRGLRWAAAFVVLALALFFNFHRLKHDGAALLEYDPASPARAPAALDGAA